MSLGFYPNVPHRKIPNFDPLQIRAEPDHNKTKRQGGAPVQWYEGINCNIPCLFLLDSAHKSPEGGAEGLDPELSSKGNRTLLALNL